MSGERLRVGVRRRGPRPGEQCQPRPGVRLRRLCPRGLGHLPGHRHRAARPRRHRRGGGRGRRAARRHPPRAPRDAGGLGRAGRRAARGPGAWTAATRCRTAGGWARRRRRSSPASSRPRACTTSRAGCAGDDVDLAFANSLASRLEGHPDNASASVHGGRDPVVDRRRRRRHHDRAPAGAPRRRAGGLRARRAAARPPRPARCCRSRCGWPTRPPTRRAPRCSPTRLGTAPEHLLAATREWLHQEARRTSYAESMALVDALRAAGHAAVISGAGPSVLVLAPARPGRRGARVRRCGLAGADPRHPAARRPRRRCSRAADRPFRALPHGCGDRAWRPRVRCYSGPCDRSRCRVSPVACRESPSTTRAAVQPCAAAPGVGSQ